MAIMVIDPSLRAFGVVIVEPGTVFPVGSVLDYACVITEKESKQRKTGVNLDNARRIDEIIVHLKYLVARFGVKLIISERPGGSKSAAAARAGSMCLAMIQAFATCMSLPLEWVGEADAKKHLAGRRNLSKEETVALIDIKFTDTGLKLPPAKRKAEAIADALSVWLYAKEHSNLVRQYIHAHCTDHSNA